MAVKIRLNRIGTKKRPFYRVVAIDSRSNRNGAHIEILGTFDPKNISKSKLSADLPEKGGVQLKTERVQHWLNVGAEVTPTVSSILKRLKISRQKQSVA